MKSSDDLTKPSFGAGAGNPAVVAGCLFLLGFGTCSAIALIWGRAFLQSEDRRQKETLATTYRPDESGTFVPVVDFPIQPVERPQVELHDFALADDGTVKGYVVNTGTVAVTDLTLALYYLDEEGKRLGEGLAAIAPGSLPMLLPGARSQPVARERPPRGASSRIDISIRQVTLDDVRVLSPDILTQGEKHRGDLSLEVVEVNTRTGSGYKELLVALRNRSDETLLGFRARLHFLDAEGQEVATWLFDTFFGGARLTEAGQPRNWFDHELFVPAGFAKDLPLILRPEPPYRWDPTPTATKFEVVAAWFDDTEVATP